MDLSDSAKYSSIRNNNVVVIDISSDNQQSSQLNENIQNKSVADKGELKKILQSVSLLYPCNSTEFVELSNQDECKIINDSTNNDSDGIELIDVVINGSHQLSNIVPNNDLISSNSTEINFEDFSRKSVIQVIPDAHVNTVSEGEVQIIHEGSSKKEISQIQEDKGECSAVNSCQVDSVLVRETVDESNSHSNCSEKHILEELMETVQSTTEHETNEDSAMCDNSIVDLPEEKNEYCSFDLGYNFNQTPIQMTGSWNEFKNSKMNNFTRGCKWAPDGSCILTCSEDNKLRIFNLPLQLWDSQQFTSYDLELESALRISEGDLIYDYCWYPLMNSNDPVTCCLVSTSKKSTVHLWDAYTGDLRCSYRSYNHLDELVTPHSLCFDSDGEKLFCGYQNSIRVFDVNRPGRICEERRVYAYKTGQYGIISCFAFTSADKNVSAAGSYNRTIGLYAEPNGELTCLLEGHSNGITQLKFSPDGKYLYSAGRKDPDILCWDLRNLGTVLFSLKRSCVTNQRMYFDISRCGKYVVSGNQNGVISFWDITKEPKIISEDDFPILVPIQFYLAHRDCVNGVSFHPSFPFLCSSSGQRKFPELLDDESEDIFSPKITISDNSLRLWYIGKLNVNN